MKTMQEKVLFYDEALKIRCFERKGRLETTVSYSHWHDEVEIVYSRKGSGMQQINESCFLLTPHTFAVIGKNQLHSFVACGNEELDLLVIQFSAEAFLKNMERDDLFCKEWLSGTLLFPCAVSASSEMMRLFERIHEELMVRDVGYSASVMSDIWRLLVFLYRLNPRRLSAKDLDALCGTNRQLLAKAFTFIGENYQREGLLLDEAAQAANLSTTHFCRMFKLATGMTFHTYLNHYRISRAQQLLGTDLSLVEIAYACGFGSSSAFTRNYKKVFQRLPRQDRRRKKES